MQQVSPRKDISAGSRYLGAQAYTATPVSIPNSATTQIPLDTFGWNFEGFTFSGAGSIIIPTDAFYIAIANFAFEAHADTNTRFANFSLNATTNVGINSTRATNSAQYPESFFAFMGEHLVAGDFLRMNVFQNSGIALNVTCYVEIAAWSFKE